MKKEKLYLGRAILSAIAAIPVYTIVDNLIILIFNLVVYLISNIPILGWLLDLLYAIREDTPYMVSVWLGATIAYLITGALIEKVTPNKRTLGLSFVITGIVIMLMHGFFLIVNLKYGDTIFANIGSIIAGFVFVTNGKSEQDQEV